MDFADVKTVMSEMGQAMMGAASAAGPNRAAEAAHNALSSPLLEDTNIRGAKGILVNVTAGPDLSIGEFGAVGGMIREMASDDATVVIGTSIDENMKDELRVTMVATGIVDGSAGKVEKVAPVEVVKSVGLAVGSSYESVESADLEEPSLMTGSRGRNSDALPVVEPQGDSQYDIPTFLRRQAD